MSRSTAALAGALAIAAAFTLWPLVAQSRAAGATCATMGYSYAGLVSDRAVYGVAATLSVASVAAVESGHAAAWVGVGGVGAGPNGTTEWLQAGLAAFPGKHVRLYYELVVPGAKRHYAELGPGLGRHRVAVLELPSRPDWWQVVVDGRAATGPIHLPGSAGRWRGVATSESWDASRRACNRFGYRFGDVSVATQPDVWDPLVRGRVLKEPGRRVVREARSAFLAL